MSGTGYRKQQPFLKIEKLVYTEIKNFHWADSPPKKMNREATDWGKIFIKHLADKGLNSRIHK